MMARMSKPEVTWWPADNGFEIARDGSTLLCRDGDQNPVAPVPESVWQTRRYPAWALVTRPTEVVAAVTADSEMLAARGWKPHDLTQRFERIAAELPAPHLPVFYERAARELARYGDRKRAAMLFDKARAAEVSENLPIADDVWLGLHLEFAKLGALSTKTVAAFVKTLKNRAAPDAAVDALTRVAILRAQAGQAPWPQLPKQLSAFAKAAGRDELTVHEGLLEQLLATDSVRESAAAMWTSWRPVLVQVCLRSPRVRGLLLHVLPVPESLDGWWLELLDECGATAGLLGPAEPGAEPVGGRAAWLARTIHHPNMNKVLAHRSRVSRLLPTQISDLIARMAPALWADGVPVQLDGPDYWTQRVDPRVLETCLANGVPVVDLKPGAGLGLDVWLRCRRPEDGLVAVAQNPRFTPSVRAWAEKGDAARLWTIPGLSQFLTPPAAAATAPHPLDGPKIYSAVHEFGGVSASPTKGTHRLLYALRMLTQSLRTDAATTVDPRLLELDETASLAGRLEWVVLRAVAPSTPPDRRELLTAFLEVWGESVLADPTTRFFHGTADFDRGFAADEHGVAMATYYARQNPKPFMALATGSPGAEPPSLGRVESVTELPVGWGTADRLRRLVELLRERGGVPADPAAAAKLAEGTGLTRYAAAMALAGLIGVGGYYMPLMKTEERKILGIAAKQVEAGRTELSGIKAEQRLDLLLGILPDDPAELWAPGGTVALAERLAAKWVAVFGRGAEVPEATIAAAPEFGSLSSKEICAALAGPSQSPILTSDIDCRLEPGHGSGAAWYTSDGYTIGEFTRWLPALVTTICWAYASLPADDPVRAGVPETVRLLRERLAHPGLILMAGSQGYGLTPAVIIERFGSNPYNGPVPLPDTTADDGLTIVASHAGSTRTYFRPSLYGKDARTTALQNALVFADFGLEAARFLTGAACDRIVDRVTTGTLPPGACEADPRASVPELVTEVAEHFGLTEAAAALYLQLLAMPNPTDTRVRTWNGWSAAEHKKTAAALVEKGLVVADRRPKSGRAIFLPGDWTKARNNTPGSRPIEAWKISFLTAMGLDHDNDWPRHPLPELFAAAWERVLLGAQPV
jgi:hypothetical protein